jgi:thioredoxin-dependent peroxiredoxin
VLTPTLQTIIIIKQVVISNWVWRAFKRKKSASLLLIQFYWSPQEDFQLTNERFGIIKFSGKEATVIGDDIKVGQKAPDFTVVKQDWSVVKGLASTKGKVRIIASVLSLDTSVCDTETRRFNIEAAGLGKDVAILFISVDTPWAQKRWCGAAGVDQITTFSDALKADFGKKYGCLIKEGRVLRRAVFVLDRKGIVTYVAYMPALNIEPNYDEVLAATKAALAR